MSLGVVEFTLGKEKYQYNGELDISDKPCGFGWANGLSG